VPGQQPKRCLREVVMVIRVAVRDVESAKRLVVGLVDLSAQVNGADSPAKGCSLPTESAQPRSPAASREVEA